MKRYSKCDGDEAAVFLSDVSAVFDSVFLRVGGLTLSSLNSFSKLCMSPPLTALRRCVALTKDKRKLMLAMSPPCGYIPIRLAFLS